MTERQEMLEEFVELMDQLVKAESRVELAACRESKRLWDKKWDELLKVTIQ